jgi:flagellin
MSLVVNTNVGSLNAQRSLAASGAELKTAMERLSSGSKINSASDDAAGFAIAERMTAQIRGLNMAAKNAGDGLSMLSAIENATNDVTDMLQRMRELAVQAVNDTNTAQDRTYLQGEVTALLAEINRVATQTQYNGENILDGSRAGHIQVGTEAGQTVHFSISSIEAANLGVTGTPITLTEIGTVQGTGTYSPDSSTASETWIEPVNPLLTGVGTPPESSIVPDHPNPGDPGIVAGDIVRFSSMPDTDHVAQSTWFYEGGDEGFRIDDNGAAHDAGVVGDTIFHKTGGGQTSLADIDVSTNPTDALATITAAIEQVAGDRAEYGALQNRLEYTVSNLMNVSEFTTAAKSRIADADFAAESARLAKAQVLQQSGTAMLAQANAASQLALSLIR